MKDEWRTCFTDRKFGRHTTFLRRGLWSCAPRRNEYVAFNTIVVDTVFKVTTKKIVRAIEFRFLRI